MQEHDGFYLPVAYAARVTNAAERNYVPLERETLAICFGCEYFHQYIYGLKDIIVEADHKPLATLFSKTLKDNPPRIQMFRMRLMKYSITVQYVPGTQMYLSDTLSRGKYTENKRILLRTVLRTSTTLSLFLFKELKDLNPTITIIRSDFK